ncbi:DUF3325 domain-containing protein [Tardiphaga alba]|uniref:DUF3325 domain-containing protein n=1 Tax=Tardiphaga alba TaxID=340268 RepID=A0ABX8A6N7_9BRAD|nr:DUF3325 domain-containing protein [Tardiphaga alba]QUS39406.1 DUF3325 domain-containing protein [Tardiphaga alba]
MSHLFALMLCVAGFASLALATHRQQRDVFKRALRPAMTYALRTVGSCALLLALGVLVAQAGWGLGLVMFSGHTSLAAGVVLVALIARMRMSSPSARRSN